MISSNAVNGAKVVNDSLTGADVAEATLGAVPNADNLGGQPWWAYQRGCSGGAVHAFVRVPAHAGFPSEWTPLPGFNCTGGQILARRASAWVYYVVFQTNPALYPLATPEAATYLSVRRVPDGSFFVGGWGEPDIPFVLVLV